MSADFLPEHMREAFDSPDMPEGLTSTEKLTYISKQRRRSDAGLVQPVMVKTDDGLAEKLETPAND